MIGSEPFRARVVKHGQAFLRPPAVIRLGDVSGEDDVRYLGAAGEILYQAGKQGGVPMADDGHSDGSLGISNRHGRVEFFQRQSALERPHVLYAAGVSRRGSPL